MDEPVCVCFFFFLIYFSVGHQQLWVNYNPDANKEKRAEESSEPIETQEVIVTEITSTGQIYVQVIGSGVQQLEKLMSDFAEHNKVPPR